MYVLLLLCVGWWDGIAKSASSSNLPKTLFILQHEKQGIGLKRRAFASVDTSQWWWGKRWEGK